MRQVLLTVAAREGEHGMTFAKRINELGYEVRCNDDSELQKAMALVKSDRSDLKKMEKLEARPLDTGDKPDIFDGLFKDHSIDIRTGELLGRYIAEERDTARLLRSCYEQLVAADKAGRRRARRSRSRRSRRRSTRCAARSTSCARSCARKHRRPTAPANGRKTARRAELIERGARLIDSPTDTLPPEVTSPYTPTAGFEPSPGMS